MMPLSLRGLAALALCLCWMAPARAIDEADLLPVDEAFALSAGATAPDRVEIRWAIADGYYLYRHRIAVQPADASASAGTLALPDGKPHTDEFFGRVETYRGQLTAILPDVVASGGRLALRIRYQGCADAGICYPPQTRTLTVALPGSEAAAPTNAGFTALGGNAPVPLLGSAPGGGVEPLPLPPEQAFRFEAIADGGNALLLRFTPARGYYLYRDRSAFRISGAPGISAARPRWPRGVSHRDGYFGDVVVYFDQVDVPLPLRRTRTDAADVTLTATFQGCQTDGICYPPMTRTVAVALPAGVVDATPPADAPVVGATEVATAVAPTVAGSIGVDPASAGTGATAPAGDDAAADDTRIAAQLAGSGRWLALLGFFGAGLLLAFTPCVLPMIPILSGLIAGRGERIGARRAFSLSFVYVLANAVVFTIAGVVAGLLGANLQVAFQTPWVIVAFALLFVALALSMFGLYELQLPARWRARLGSLSDRQHGGSWAGVAAMGALSALIVGPCVAPPLAAAVLYIGQTRDPAFGGAALFLLAMGMGAPLLAFGVAAGRGLPTSGPWMLAVQRVFGFVFLALAVWMLSRLLPGPAALALYGLLALAAATWLFSLARPEASERVRWAARFAGAVLAVVGIAEVFGALAGGRDPLQPLAGVVGERREGLEFRTIKSLADLDREVAAARVAGRPLLFDFYADWCVSCREMEKYTFTRPEVHAALAGFVLLKADVTANDDLDQALMQRLGIIGPPATLFFVDGRERRELRLFGFERAAPFVQRIQRVGR